MHRLYSAVSYWLVKHPTVANFEWKQGRIWGASPLFLGVTIFSYLFFTFLLWRSTIPSLHPRLLRPIAAVHNLILFTLSLTMAVGCCLSALSQMPDSSWIFCFPANQTPPRGPVFFWAYIFYLSKIAEFADTLLIVLGGSTRRLSFLHVYHHAAVVVMCYVWLSASQSLFPVALATNATVHTLMYAYYLSCALGKKPKWKRIVTEVQIVQFVFSFAISGVMLYHHFTGLGCSGIGGWCFNAVFNASLLFLFLDFHSKNYLTKREKADRDKWHAAQPILRCLHCCRLHQLSSLDTCSCRAAPLHNRRP